jgi:hypothetical protein
VETTWTAESDPQLVAIGRAVREVLRLGLRPAKLAMAPGTFVLADPEVLLNAATPLEVAWSVEERCLKALDRFGDGPAGAALRLLLGASAQSRSLPLKTRRRLAAEEVGVYPETFRKLWEADLLEDFVAEVAR